MAVLREEYGEGKVFICNGKNYYKKLKEGRCAGTLFCSFGVFYYICGEIMKK